MIMQDDVKDVMLMRDQPFMLLLKYQNVFKIITRRYARCGYYSFRECDEILQHINEKMFSRIENIIEHFDGRVLVRTYLSAICRNVIKEYIRTFRRRKQLFTEYAVMEPEIHFPNNIDLLFKEECLRLDKVLLLWGDKRHKMWLIMKLIFKIRVDIYDFIRVHKSASSLIDEEMIERFNRDMSLKDRDIYRIIYPLFQLVETKISHPDTLRKWFNKKMAEVIALMNGNPPRAAYSEETIQILVEKYWALVDCGKYSPLFDHKCSASEHEYFISILKTIRRKQ